LDEPRLSFTCSPPRGGGDNLLCQSHNQWRMRYSVRTAFTRGLEAPNRGRSPVALATANTIPLGSALFHPPLWPPGHGSFTRLARQPERLHNQTVGPVFRHLRAPVCSHA